MYRMNWYFRDPLPPKPTPTDILSTSRDCAQALINQLLTTCPIKTSSTGDLVIALPAPTTPLPREKPLPTPKGETKWEKFAAAKGIQKRRRERKEWDEEKQEWVNRWGKDGKNKRKPWITEVPTNSDA